MGERYFRFDDACILMFGAMSSGTFFDSLQRIQTADGIRYTWNSKPWKYYPTELRADLFGKRTECPDKPLLSTRLIGSTREFMKNAKIKLEWKNNLDVYAIEDSVLTFREPPIGSAEETWEYTFRLHPNNVPLSFHLVISVSNSSQQTIARFSGRP